MPFFNAAPQAGVATDGIRRIDRLQKVVKALHVAVQKQVCAMQ